ncbi:MAG: hypothetical protein JSS27_09975 [Planctomycetes bacterium]|nr:hypothetical protein [Planctomycetota bacterium]
MTEIVQKLLASFGELSDADQAAFAKLIVAQIRARREEKTDESPASDEEMAFLADQLFLMYDAEESEHA